MTERRTRTLCFALIVLFVSGCPGTHESELSSVTRNSQRISPDILFHRAHSELEEPVRRSIRSESELGEFLQGALPQEMQRFADQVDFSGSFVAVAGMGTRPTGGFNVAIPDAYVRRDSMFVLVQHTIPGKDCMVPQVQTSPVEAVILPKVVETVRFVVNERTLSCE